MRSSGLVGLSVILVVLFVAFLSFSYMGSKEEGIAITPTRGERVAVGSGDSMSHKYLVWTAEGEVFEVTDSVLFGTFNSADRYGKLLSGTGNPVSVDVAGWRITWLSSYRNIIKVHGEQQ